MALNDYLLSVAFGARQVPDAYEFVLVRDGKPVNGSPTPTVAPDGFRTTATGASTDVVFGPADVALEFDAVAVRAGGDVVDVWPVGRSTIPPGMVFRFTAIWALQEV